MRVHPSELMIMDDREVNQFQNLALRQVFLAAAIGLLCLISNPWCSESVAQDANFIWSPQLDVRADGGLDAEGTSREVFYRKRFTLVSPDEAQLQVAAGDEFDVYINGRLIARGESYGEKSSVDAAPLLRPGINLIAARVRHLESSSVGFAMRLRVKEKGEVRYRSLVSDSSWKTYTRKVDDWNQNRFNDMSWLAASEVTVADVLSLIADKKSGSAISGDAENSEPADVAKVSTQAHESPIESNQPANAKFETKAQPVAKANVASVSKKAARFLIDPEFEIEQVLTHEETGSLIAMEFDEFGRMLLSREGGPLLIADPSLSKNNPNRIRTYCEDVTSVQGILPLNGDVFVTGQGPEGQALYRLSDPGRKGSLSVSQTLIKFSGEVGEHGAHGIQLGPDGMIYVVLGNATKLQESAAKSSPFQHPYEGDLVARFEDPNGQSAGVRAPGGTVIRTSIDGSLVETVAGGLRNAYDLVFDSKNNLFVHDSDMETDEGSTWYRPTMIYNIVAGGDYGWRSGWAKFPQHFIDQVPAVLETERGSPTGAVLYQHVNFPTRYQDSVFFADWSEGRILTMRTEARGAGFVGKVETFATGKPMNVCDLSVDPEGALCFCTGGRGTDGGVFRIRWKGQVPQAMKSFDSDIARVIRQPQPSSAWGRQQIAQLRRKIGAEWDNSIVGVALESRNPLNYRTRAMNLMMLYGPKPDAAFLKSTSEDPEPQIRALAAQLSGVSGNQDKRIKSLLTDGNAMVRRLAAESALRQNVEVSFDDLEPMLKSYDRIESLVARRLLERMPSDEFDEQVFESDDRRIFIQGALAMMIAQPSLENSYRVLARVSNFMDGFLNDADFVDMMRVAQLALVRGEIDPAKIPAFAQRIGNEFPAGNSVINQELIRLLAYLEKAELDGRLEDYLLSDETPDLDKHHAAMLMQTIGRKLPADSKLAIIETLEGLRTDGANDAGNGYLQRAIREVAATLEADQIPVVLENGETWTEAMLATLFLLPPELDFATVDHLKRIDAAIADKEGESIVHLRTGIIAVLAQSADAQSMAYLRKLWESEPDRRSEISMGLAQEPGGENWGYLVSSLDVLDDSTGAEVLGKLVSVARRPRDAKHYRDVIALGYRLREKGVAPAVELLEHWSGTIRPNDGKPWQETMEDWKKWYEVTFPGSEPISIDAGKKTAGRSVHEIMESIAGARTGDAIRGQSIFKTANCAKCHRCRGMGNAIGPDLTNLSSRFSKREMIVATVDPNKDVAMRYQSSIIELADGRQIEGLTATDVDGSTVVLLANGDRVRVAAEEIESMKVSKSSPMPAGLIDDLDAQEVADLITFMSERPDRSAQN